MIPIVLALNETAALKKSGLLDLSQSVEQRKRAQDRLKLSSHDIFGGLQLQWLGRMRDWCLLSFLVFPSTLLPWFCAATGHIVCHQLPFSGHIILHRQSHCIALL